MSAVGDLLGSVTNQPTVSASVSMLVDGLKALSPIDLATVDSGVAAIAVMSNTIVRSQVPGWVDTEA